MSVHGYHKPVLVEQVVHYLDPQPGKVYVDATFGGGGHTAAILEHQPACTVIGIDWDATALELNAPAIEKKFGDRFTAIRGNFAQLPVLLKRAGITKVDGMLADFGPSQYQILHKEGFSFTSRSPLDMRMAPEYHKKTAFDIINTASQDELEYIFREYGEERAARRIARGIVEKRRARPIKTAYELALLVKETVAPHRSYFKIHPATQVFQALRIAVNKEFENIRAFLVHSPALLNPHGRVVCISFHSLEDRAVKHFFKEHAEFRVLTPKVVTATPEELQANPSARSARLRAAELIVE